MAVTGVERCCRGMQSTKLDAFDVVPHLPQRALQTLHNCLREALLQDE